MAGHHAMASLLHRQIARRRDALHEDLVAVIDTAEFEEAQRDPRVRVFLEEADEYLADLERQGRNR
jgi:hypothetical protein